MSEGILSKIGIQEESSFGGSGTGPLFLCTGLAEVTYRPVIQGRAAKVNIWRQEETESEPNTYYEGRFDLEANTGAVLNLLLSSFFTLRETEIVVAGTRNRWRPVRAGVPALQSFKIYVDQNSQKWKTLHGVVLKNLRITARARQMAHITCEFVCQKSTFVDISPGWNFTVPARDNLTGTDSILTIEGSEFEDGIEISTEFAWDAQPCNFDAIGQPRKIARRGVAQITGTITEYDNAEAFPEASAAGQEIEINFRMNGAAGKKLEFNFPRAKLQGTEENPVNRAGITDTLPFRVMQDLALNPSGEVFLEIIF